MLMDGINLNGRTPVVELIAPQRVMDWLATLGSPYSPWMALPLFYEGRRQSGNEMTKA